MRGLSNLIPLKGRSVGSDKITKLLSYALVFGMLQSILIGVQINNAPSAQASASTGAVSSSIKVSPIPGGGIGSSNCPTGSVLYEIVSSRGAIDNSSALTQTYGNCANLNTVGTQINTYTASTTSFGGAGNTQQSQWCGGTGSTRAIAGARVYKTANNYTSGLELICKDLPTSPFIGYLTGQLMGVNPVGKWEDITCPVGTFAVGLNVHFGGIIDALGFNCAPVINATQASFSSATLSVTSKTYPYSTAISVSSSSGGSGAGAVSITSVANGSAAGCAFSSNTISSSSAGTCTVTVTKAADLNYAATTRTETFTFNKASLTVTASSPVVNLGGAIPTITPIYSGFVNSENSSSPAFTTGLVAPTCTTSYTAASTVDTSPATVCSGGSSTGYSFSYVSGRVLILSGNDRALSLNGSNQHASASGAQVIPASTASAFTVEAWIRQPSTRSSTAFYQILSQGTSGNEFYIKVVDGSVKFRREGFSETTCNLRVPTEEWTHVAIVVGTTSQTCYINGSLAGSFTQTSTTPIGTTFAVGQYAPLGGEFFLGQIDEVKIWSDARTQSEIQSGLNTYGGTLVDNLVAHYDFNELVGSRIYNRSTGGSSALDLTTVNSPTITSTSIIETSTVQAYTVVRFMRSFLVAAGGWTPPINRQLRVLVVGGGGGGNRGVCAVNYGAGGGGGQAKEQTIASASSAVFSVSVGPGGARAAGNCNDTSGMNGGSSSFGDITSVGGTAALFNSRVGGSSGSNTGGTSSSNFGAGGGGGAGGAGGPNGVNNGKNGGPGYLFPITGLTYGGGGAGLDASAFGTASGGGSDGSANAAPNRGGGGADWTSGGSGVVIVAYITTTPTILTQPLSDTTTAGIVETFTVTTSVAPAPLTKSVQWQFTTDTATGVTGWTNVSSGTGGTTDTFTTVALTTSMNKYRFRAIVTFSDTLTLSVQETSTVAILTINPAITITSDTSTITRKYGDTQTVRTIVYSGGTTESGTVGVSTSHTVRGSFGTQSSGRIVLDTSTATAVFRVDTRTVVGTYVETITVTDARGATATYTQRVVVTQADTLTVQFQADTLTAITFGGTLSPTATVTGLVPGDAVSSTTFGHISCANGGRCAVGDIGPGGGVVFHVITNSSDSQTAIAGYTSGGIYLEAAPVGWGNGIPVAAGETTGTSYLDPVVNWCNTATDINNRQVGIGQGANNTRLGDIGCTSGAVQIAADWTSPNGLNDWYLPSQNELEQMGLQKNLIGLIYGLTNCFGTTCYWSSTEVSGSSSRALQVNVESNVMGSNDKRLNASNQVMMRPIRAFSPRAIGQETVTAGAPTAAGTYTLRPTAITLAEGVNTNNYVFVDYRSSSVTINRATQSPRISMQPASVAYDTGTVTQALTATSGPGTGAVFYLIGAGSAATCSISGSTVRISADGVCNVVAYKQASTNYLADSATAVAITFTRFIPRPVQVQLYPSMIPLNQGNTLEKSALPQALLTITNVATTSSSSYTVTGTGFNSISLIRIGTNDLVAGTNYTVTPTTSITITNAAGMAGPLYIELSDGQRAVFFTFPNNPE